MPGSWLAVFAGYQLPATWYQPMPSSGIGYALLCVTVPMAWGLLVVWLSNRIEDRLRRGKEREIPPIDYHI
ncbi:MAG TPA: hypothetical protein VKT77_08335 [Chthonomonadaceae bacterium]|nr:hypothetical protein [Chthonomonadaceae bacterium]